MYFPFFNQLFGFFFFGEGVATEYLEFLVGSGH